MRWSRRVRWWTDRRCDGFRPYQGNSGRVFDRLGLRDHRSAQRGDAVAHLQVASRAEALFGTYWSSTERSHVIYESRLELARLLYADLDAAVHGIVAQPFLLKATVDRRVRRHVPDFLLVDEQGPVVVDVKPVHGLVIQRSPLRSTGRGSSWRDAVGVTRFGANRQRRNSPTFASLRASVVQGVSTALS